MEIEYGSINYRHFKKRYINFLDLVGKILKGIYIDSTKSILIFDFVDSIIAMHHYQNCCESVNIVEVSGVCPIIRPQEVLYVEEVTSNSMEDMLVRDSEISMDIIFRINEINFENNYESATYTFYKLTTATMDLFIRWNGESNGYYSETVDIDELTEMPTNVILLTDDYIA